MFSILNMRTVSTDSDLNTRTRIRDAAIRSFAEHGFNKSSIRSIAATAGVSPALIIHHFTNKNQLREACDDAVLEALMRRADSKTDPIGLQQLIREQLADPGKDKVILDYLAKALAENSRAGHRFAEILTAETESILRTEVAAGSMRPLSDTRATAALLVLNSLAMLAMPGYLATALGRDSGASPLDPAALGSEVLQRLALPALELYTYGLYTDDTMLRAAREALGDGARATPDEQTSDS